MNMIAPRRERLVVIGNGMAGMRTVETLLRLAPNRYDITVFGAEPHPNYDRIALSSVLAGEKSLEEIVINGRGWYAENGIRLLAGDPVVAIDRLARAAPIIVSTSATSRKAQVPGRPRPGLGGANGFEPVAISSRS